MPPAATSNVLQGLRRPRGTPRGIQSVLSLPGGIPPLQPPQSPARPPLGQPPAAPGQAQPPGQQPALTGVGWNFEASIRPEEYAVSPILASAIGGPRKAINLKRASNDFDTMVAVLYGFVKDSREKQALTSWFNLGMSDAFKKAIPKPTAASLTLPPIAAEQPPRLPVIEELPQTITRTGGTDKSIVTQPSKPTAKPVTQLFGVVPFKAKDEATYDEAAMKAEEEQVQKFLEPEIAKELSLYRPAGAGPPVGWTREEWLETGRAQAEAQFTADHRGRLYVEKIWKPQFLGATNPNERTKYIETISKTPEHAATLLDYLSRDPGGNRDLLQELSQQLLGDRTFFERNRPYELKWHANNLATNKVPQRRSESIAAMPLSIKERIRDNPQDLPQLRDFSRRDLIGIVLKDYQLAKHQSATNQSLRTAYADPAKGFHQLQSLGDDLIADQIKFLERRMSPASQQDAVDYKIYRDASMYLYGEPHAQYGSTARNHNFQKSVDQLIRSGDISRVSTYVAKLPKGLQNLLHLTAGESNPRSKQIMLQSLKQLSRPELDRIAAAEWKQKKLWNTEVGKQSAELNSKVAAGATEPRVALDNYEAFMGEQIDKLVANPDLSPESRKNFLDLKDPNSQARRELFNLQYAPVIDNGKLEVGIRYVPTDKMKAIQLGQQIAKQTFVQHRLAGRNVPAMLESWGLPAIGTPGPLSSKFTIGRAAGTELRPVDDSLSAITYGMYGNRTPEQIWKLYQSKSPAGSGEQFATTFGRMMEGINTPIGRVNAIDVASLGIPIASLATTALAKGLAGVGARGLSQWISANTMKEVGLAAAKEMVPYAASRALESSGHPTLATMASLAGASSLARLPSKRRVLPRLAPIAAGAATGPAIESELAQLGSQASKLESLLGGGEKGKQWYGTIGQTAAGLAPLLSPLTRGMDLAAGLRSAYEHASQLATERGHTGGVLPALHAAGESALNLLALKKPWLTVPSLFGVHLAGARTDQPAGLLYGPKVQIRTLEDLKRHPAPHVLFGHPANEPFSGDERAALNQIISQVEKMRRSDPNKFVQDAREAGLSPDQYAVKTTENLFLQRGGFEPQEINKGFATDIPLPKPTMTPEQQQSALVAGLVGRIGGITGGLPGMPGVTAPATTSVGETLGVGIPPTPHQRQQQQITQLQQAFPHIDKKDLPVINATLEATRQFIDEAKQEMEAKATTPQRHEELAKSISRAVAVLHGTTQSANNFREQYIIGKNLSSDQIRSALSDPKSELSVAGVRNVINDDEFIKQFGEHMSEPEQYGVAMTMWQRLSNWHKTLVIGGMSLTALGLLLSFTGGGDEDEEDRRGGGGVPWAPLLGLGGLAAAGYGITRGQPMKLIEPGFHGKLWPEVYQGVTGLFGGSAKK